MMSREQEVNTSNRLETNITSSSSNTIESKPRHQTYSDAHSDLKLQNHRLEKESSELRHENSLLAANNRELNALLARLESNSSKIAAGDMSSNENIGNNNFKALSLQKDEVQRRLNEVSHNYEVLRSQYSQAMARHSDELAKAKNIEIELNDEAERLTSDLKKLRELHMNSDLDRHRIELLYKTESLENSQTIQALKSDIEKYKREVQECYEFRYASQQEKDTLENIVRELKIKYSRLEESFKLSESSSNTKIKSVSSEYEMKMHQLEVEKENLLKDLQCKSEDCSRVEQDCLKLRDKYKSLHKEYMIKDNLIDALQTNISKLESDLKSSEEKCNELKSKLTKESFESEALREQMDRFTSGKLSMYEARIKELEENKVQKSSTLSALQEDYDALLKQYNNSLSSIESLKDKATSSFEAIEEYKSSTINLSSLLEDSKKSNALLSNECDKRTKECAKLKEQLDSLEAHNKESIELIEKTNRLYIESVEQSESVKAELSQIRAENQRNVEELNRHHKMLVSKQEQIEKCLKDNNDLKELMNTERRRLQQHVISWQDKHKQLLEEHSALKLEHDNKMNENEKAYSILKSSTSMSIQQLISELKESDELVQSERKKYMCEIRDLQKSLDDLRHRYQSLEEELEAITSKSIQDKNAFSMKILHLERLKENLASDISVKEQLIIDLTDEKENMKVKIKALKAANRSQDEQLLLYGDNKMVSPFEEYDRMTADSSDTSQINSSITSTKAPDIAFVSSDVKTSSSATPREALNSSSLSLDDNAHGNKSSDPNDVIIRTQKILDKKVASSNDSYRQTGSDVSYNNAANAALALVSSVYESHKIGVSPVVASGKDEKSDYGSPNKGKGQGFRDKFSNLISSSKTSSSKN